MSKAFFLLLPSIPRSLPQIKIKRVENSVSISARLEKWESIMIGRKEEGLNQNQRGRERERERGGKGRENWYGTEKGAKER